MKEKTPCQGHPAGPFDPMGQTVFCDGSCVDTNYVGNDEPVIDDTVHYCPDCETPNQFGELCPRCISDRQVEMEAFTQ